jgi:hypothetical protein
LCTLKVDDVDGAGSGQERIFNWIDADQLGTVTKQEMVDFEELLSERAKTPPAQSVYQDGNGKYVQSGGIVDAKSAQSVIEFSKIQYEMMDIADANGNEEVAEETYCDFQTQEDYDTDLLGYFVTNVLNVEMTNPATCEAALTSSTEDADDDTPPLTDDQAFSMLGITLRL